MNNLTRREKAIRAAALIDTDGCISINKSSPEQFIVRCSFVNTRKELTDWLLREFGGSVQEINSLHHKDGYNRKSRYVWTVAARKAEGFLKEIYPFLILKQEQADCALELRKHQGYHKHDSISTKEKMAKWKPYYLQMRALNSN